MRVLLTLLLPSLPDIFICRTLTISVTDLTNFPWISIKEFKSCALLKSSSNSREILVKTEPNTKCCRLFSRFTKQNFRRTNLATALFLKVGILILCCFPPSAPNSTVITLMPIKILKWGKNQPENLNWLSVCKAHLIFSTNWNASLYCCKSAGLTIMVKGHEIS